MADEESVKPNTDETLEGSSSDEGSDHGDGGENDETVKSFKDLVGLLQRAKEKKHFRHINTERSLLFQLATTPLCYVNLILSF